MKKYLLGVIAFFALDSVCAFEQPMVVEVSKFECREYTNGYILVVQSDKQGGPVYTIVARKGANTMSLHETTEVDGQVNATEVGQAVGYNGQGKIFHFTTKQHGRGFLSLNFGAFNPPLDGDGFHPAREVPYGEQSFEVYFTAANARFQLGGQPWSCNIL